MPEQLRGNIGYSVVSKLLMLCLRFSRWILESQDPACDD